MKCSSIKLSSRWDIETKRRIWKEDENTPSFTGEKTHSYSFPFFRMKSSMPSKPTTLAITTITPPENFECFNTGASLDRWSKKRARLKSARLAKTPTEDDKIFCYETLETDLSNLLNESEDPPSRDGSLSNLQYEVHSDIEQLLLKSERSGDEVEDTKHRRKKRNKEKKKKKKIIKFSKSPSPQTEQVIRVDVTSNVSEETRRRPGPLDNCGKDGVIDDKRKELKRNLNETSAEMCDEDFIVRCRQLALRQRRRRL